MRVRNWDGWGTGLGAIMRQNQSNYPPLTLSSPTSKVADWAEGRWSEGMNEEGGGGRKKGQKRNKTRSLGPNPNF